MREKGGKEQQHNQIKMAETKHKPVVETIINTAAIALVTFAVANLTQEGSFIETAKYIILILVAMGLEFFKYYGRKQNYW